MTQPSRRFKSAGRKAGSPNVSNKFLRGNKITFSASDGYVGALGALARVLKKSKADVQHQALQELGYRHLTDAGDKIHVTKIQ